MSEIEKMYENAGLFYCNKCRHDSELDCIYMCESKHPPFTAGKQLKLIVFFVRKGFKVSFDNYTEDFSLESIQKSLAMAINNKWQSLTEKEKEQIKEILQ